MTSESVPTKTGGREATEGVIRGRFALSVGNPETPTPEGWQWVKLSDVARLETGHTPARKHPQYWDGDIPWVGIKDATSNHGFVIDDTFQHVTQEGIDNSSARILPANTVCLSRTASVGYVIVMGRPMATSQDFVNWVCSDKIDYRYLAAILYAENSSFSLFSRGTTHQTIYFTEAKGFYVLLPSIEKQKEIADVIWNLIDKIQLNRQTNQTLEHISQAIFKSWFVDFEPTRAKITAKENGQDPERAAMCAISGKSLDELELLGSEQIEQLKTTAALFPDALVESELGEIPEGWEVKPLGEMIDFNPRRTLKKGTLAPYLDMKNVPTQGHLADDVYLREMASGTKFINGDTLLARITPCLQNGKTAFVDFLEEDQVGWGSTEYIIMRPNGERPVSLGYLIARLDSFRSKAIQSMTGTSGRQRANAKALSDQLWVNYPLKLLEVFDSVSGRYLAKAKEAGDESKSLAELRNTLLPKLLSGELSPTTQTPAPNSKSDMLNPEQQTAGGVH